MPSIPFRFPNWLGHLLLVLLHLFLPAYLAEKIFILGYFFGIAYSFRWLIKTIEPEANLSTFLIFPFTYSFLLILGFYNYSLSFIFLFLTLGYWYKHKNSLNLRKGIILSLLVTAVYFSHLFTFLLLGLSFVIFILWDLFFDKANHPLKETFRQQLYYLTGIFSVPIILAIDFFLHTTAAENTIRQRYTVSELCQRLFEVRAVICWSYAHEKQYTEGIGICLLVLIASLLVFYFFSIIRSKIRFKEKNSALKAVWLFLSIVLLIFLFIIPNGLSPGMFSDRLEILFFLFLVIWISIQKIPSVIMAVPVVTMLVLHFILVFFYQRQIEFQNSESKEWEQIGRDIGENRTVLSVSNSKNWIDGHYSCYMGVDKPLIILNDYEAELKWFPLIWNTDSVPDFYLGDLPQDGFCYWWYHNPKNSIEKIDYVVRSLNQTNDNNVCNLRIDSVLKRNYQLIKSYRDAELYRIKVE